MNCKFSSNQFSFGDTVPSVASNTRLREPQREAYRAVAEHFSRSNSPVLLQIPVGGGKTGLLSILPFGIAKGRVLIIAPNVNIREAIFQAVNSASHHCFWNRTGVVKPSVSGPFAAILDGPNANFEDCIESHYVVANVQQLAREANRWLKQMPSHFFDMLIIDEGHHNAAKSWRRLVEHFPEAKVISLTATPFRSDGQDVLGEPIYRYTFRRAMERGYIKTLRAIQVSTHEISFTFRDSQETATLEQVLKLREEAWFSRGVALADECNQHIVAASRDACLQLRKGTTTKHQIIAAACSVEHAQRLAQLYSRHNLVALEIHSKQSKATQRFVLQQLRSGKLDVIIQVQMLGEGFDHPSLSVAAIFRPFRSLSPYVQFVGRVMRVVRQGMANHPDNRGIVVSHVGMNTEGHWEQFRDLDTEDQSLWAELIRGGNLPRLNDPNSSQNSVSPDADGANGYSRDEMFVEWDRGGGHAVSTYATIESQPAEKLLDPPQDTIESHIEVAIVVGPQERRRQAGQPHLK